MQGESGSGGKKKEAVGLVLGFRCEEGSCVCVWNGGRSTRNKQFPGNLVQTRGPDGDTQHKHFVFRTDTFQALYS